MMKIALLALIMLVGAYANNGLDCPFHLDPPVVSDVTSQTFEYRLTTNESVTNITEKINNIQEALGFKDQARIDKMASDIVNYIDAGDIGSNKTLVWDDITSSPSTGVKKIIRLSAQVNQSGARRILSVTAKYVTVTQEIPEVYTYKIECRIVKGTNDKGKSGHNNKASPVTQLRQLQQNNHGGKIQQLIKNALNKVKSKVSHFPRIVCDKTKVKRELNILEKFLVECNMKKGVEQAQKLLDS